MVYTLAALRWITDRYILPVFELPGIDGVEPPVFGSIPQTVSCPRVTPGGQFQHHQRHSTYGVHSAEDSNDKEHGQCSKSDQ